MDNDGKIDEKTVICICGYDKSTRCIEIYYRLLEFVRVLDRHLKSEDRNKDISRLLNHVGSEGVIITSLYIGDSIGSIQDIDVLSMNNLSGQYMRVIEHFFETLTEFIDLSA